MTLEEFMKTKTPSDRLIVCDVAGNELYKGFVACMVHYDIDNSREIKRHGLATEIFRKEKRDGFIAKQATLKEGVPVESISDFAFSDLEMLIYTRVVLEG